MSQITDIFKGAPGLVEISHSLRAQERIYTEVFNDAPLMSRAIAAYFAKEIRRTQSENRQIVLGLISDSTPLFLYQELVRLHQQEALSFKNVVVFLSTEYLMLPPEHIQAHHCILREKLIKHIDIPESQVNYPPIQFSLEEADQHARIYEEKIEKVGGIDIQLMGVGLNGRLTYNEPHSSPFSATRVISLSRSSIGDLEEDFHGVENVPRFAITLGIATLLRAKTIIVFAIGEGKAEICSRIIEEPEHPLLPCSYLQRAPQTIFVMDKPAANLLKRYVCPWSVKGEKGMMLHYDAKLTKKAVFWLAQKLQKPILSLTGEDYHKNGLRQLIQQNDGSFMAVNEQVFCALAETLTVWPGGGAPPHMRDNITRLSVKATHQKRILIFSPHPDDDVICMGATMAKMVQQGHDVHTAYQTSGSNAVFDFDASKNAYFVSELMREFQMKDADLAKSTFDEILNEEKTHAPGTRYSAKMNMVKTLTRRGEARWAALICGLQGDHIHHLDLPFYDKKVPLGPEDIKIVKDLIDSIKPDQI